jgi:hypothetical protein
MAYRTDPPSAGDDDTDRDLRLCMREVRVSLRSLEILCEGLETLVRDRLPLPSAAAESSGRTRSFRSSAADLFAAGDLTPAGGSLALPVKTIQEVQQRLDTLEHERDVAKAHAEGAATALEAATERSDKLARRVALVATVTGAVFTAIGWVLAHVFHLGG